MDRPQALLRFAPPWKSDREVLIGTQRQDHEKNAAATRVASLVRSAQAAGSRNLMRSRFCMLKTWFLHGCSDQNPSQTSFCAPAFPKARVFGGASLQDLQVA